MSDTVLAVAKTAGGWLVISLHNLQGYLRSPQITEGSWVLDLMVTGSHLQESSKSLKQRVQDIIGSISGSHAVPLPSQPIVQEQVRETVKTMGRRLEKGMDILTRGSWEVILTPQPLFLTPISLLAPHLPILQLENAKASERLPTQGSRNRHSTVTDSLQAHVKKLPRSPVM